MLERKLIRRFIDHATGIVIGETTVIEKTLNLSRVTLGALSVSKK
jgi:serine O-acetyltransferase